ncbi:MAG: hypothetical protein V1788_00825 [Nanoarchaeota archaeon]
MKSKFCLSIFGILFGILIMQSILAIGITPARTTINFEQGLSKEVSFSILNSEKKDMSVVFTVRGDLAEYITLNQAYAEFSSSEESKSFTYLITLPQSSLSSGKHEAEIVALEVPKDVKEKGTFVGATLAVVTQLHVYVPYPDKYVDAEVNVIESGGQTIFFIPVTSRGKLDIVEIKATIDIYSGDEQKIATIDSNTDSLLSLERKELVAKWDASVNPGRYKAVVTVRYDNEVTTVLKGFNIGEMFLELQEIIVKDFQLGGIAKINALVENKWSSLLKDVYLNILIYNNEGETMADFKSPNYEIPSLSKLEMVAYWDTAGVREGTYDGKIILKYGEKATERNVQIKITNSNIEFIGLTGLVVVKGGGGFNLNKLLVAVVILLVIFNFIWFVIVKRIMKKRENKK